MDLRPVFFAAHKEVEANKIHSLLLAYIMVFRAAATLLEKAGNAAGRTIGSSGISEMEANMKWMCAIAGAAMLVACQTPEEFAEKKERLQTEIAAKQGERVDRICFTSGIDGWRELGDDAVLLRKSVNDWYKLDLSGTCEPQWAFNAIAIETRPSGACVSRGDEIKTFDQAIDGTCFITAIYEWDDDAEIADAMRN